MPHFVTTIIELAGAHSYLAYGLVFVLAGSESLPVIGVFIPATAIIVTISALVPSGAISLWPLITSAAAGAIFGDGISYWLGHHYHQGITERWPLKRYPTLMIKGEAFFERHGGKSVIIARFVPGVRSVVPLIAGILRMPVMRFYTMNVLSAILWAPSHIFAGALIGASFLLLGAVGGRLVFFLAILATALCLLVVIVRVAWRRIPALATRTYDWFSQFARTHDSWTSRHILSLLDPTQTEVRALAALGAVLIGSLWVFFGILEDVVGGDPLVRADVAVFYFLRELRTDVTDQVMIAVTELGDGIVTIAVASTVIFWLAWRGAWRAAAYWTVTICCAALFTAVLKLILHHPRPIEIYSGWEAYSFPSGHATISTALYSFLAMLIAREAPARWRLWVLVAGAVWVFAIAFSRLYLGAHWLSDVLAGLAFGVSWSALLSIAYFRRSPLAIDAASLCVVVGVTLTLVGGLHIAHENDSDIIRYAINREQRAISLTDWSQHGWADLPNRRVDLAGEYEEPLTLQWAGNADEFERMLLSAGWQLPVPWSIRSSVAWITPQVTLAQLPVLPRLHNGRMERLIMVRLFDDGGHRARLVLRLWPSNVELRGEGASGWPLWIGTVTIERMKAVDRVMTLTQERPDMNTPRNMLALTIAEGRIVHRADKNSGEIWDGNILLAWAPAVH